MGSWITYKGLQVPDSATGDGGINLTNDLKALADRAPYQAATDPTVNDDAGDGFIPGSQWLNTSTLTMWVCTDNSSGAAQWRSLYRRIDNAIVLAPQAGIGGTDNRAIQLDTGGDPRGINAVDLQRMRGLDTQVASGAYAFIAGGRFNVSSGDSSHVEGVYNVANNFAAHAEGNAGFATGFLSHAEGEGTTASGYFAHAEGWSTTSSNCASHAEGINTIANGSATHAEGQGSLATGIASHSEGYCTSTSGNFSHAEGHFTNASSCAAHAEGRSTNAGGCAAHAEGQSTSASGWTAHAEGRYTTASGVSSHAEGNGAYASYSVSHAEGDWTHASGFASHAEGSCGVVASGFASHAQGSDSVASGRNAHSEGNNTLASGSYSHAGGFRSKAHLAGQWARASGGHSYSIGTAQATMTYLFRLTSNSTPTELTIGGTAPSSDTRFTILDGQTLSCFINIVGRKENGSTNDHGSFLRQVLIRREGSTTALVGSVQTIGTDINPAGWGGVTITADDTNESLKIEVAGASSTNIRWMATVMASEVADAAI